jgi:acyl-CoA thioester hydrolase
MLTGWLLAILRKMEKQNQPARHRSSIRVRYAETDQMGVVYYANYYVWMEIGRVEFVRSRGISYKEIEEQTGLRLAVTESRCRYLAPARYDQEILIDTWVAASTSRVIEFEYELRLAGEERLIAKGSTRHMWLNREWRPSHLPEQYAAGLS